MARAGASSGVGIDSNGTCEHRKPINSYSNTVNGNSVWSSETTKSVNNAGADRLRMSVLNFYERKGNENNLFFFDFSEKKNMTYLRSLRILFLSAVTRLIERQIKLHKFDFSQHLTPASSLFSHAYVARNTTLNTIRVDNVLDDMLQMLLKSFESGQALVLAGPEGSGKTVLASLLAASCSRLGHQLKTVFRVIGLTLSNSSFYHLLVSLIRQLSFIQDTNIYIPTDLTEESALSVFCKMVHDMCDRNVNKLQVIFVLDGLYKIPDLLPSQLSDMLRIVCPNTTIMVTLLNRGPLFESVSTLQCVKIFMCPTFTGATIECYLKAYLISRERTLNCDQLNAVYSVLSVNCSPLIIKIITHMVCQWPSYTVNDEINISDNLECAFLNFVKHCENRVGYYICKYIFSLLVSSRYGLSESEILHIVSNDTKFFNELKAETEKLDNFDIFSFQLYVSRFLYSAEVFLTVVKTEGETILQLSHESLKNIVRQRYLIDNFRHHIHYQLALFFQYTRRGQLLPSRDIVENKHARFRHYLWRTLRSVPYHYCLAFPESREAWQKLKSEVFVKFLWIINEIYLGFYNDFIDDIDTALRTLGLDAGMLSLRQFLINTRRTIIFNPLSLASVLAGYTAHEIDEIRQLALQARDWLQQVHLQVLVPTSYMSKNYNELRVNASLSNNFCFNMMISLKRPIMYLQYEHHITSLNCNTLEECSLYQTDNAIIESIILEGYIILVIRCANATICLKTFDLNTNSLVISSILPDASVQWLAFHNNGNALYFSKCYIRMINLRTGDITDMLKTNEDIIYATTSSHPLSTIFTLHLSPNPFVKVVDPQKPASYHSVLLPKDFIINDIDKPLRLTYHIRRLIVVGKRQIILIDVEKERIMQIIEFNNVPISLVIFSRSYEHIFVATFTRHIFCYELHDGNCVMDSKISSDSNKEQYFSSLQSYIHAPSFCFKQSQISNITNKNILMTSEQNNRLSDCLQIDKQEWITSMVTSVDDHFIFAGTSYGRTVVLHVGTGLSVSQMNVGNSLIRQVICITWLNCFQYLAFLDEAGHVSFWNFLPLITNARAKLLDVVQDKVLQLKYLAR